MYVTLKLEQHGRDACQHLQTSCDLHGLSVMCTGVNLPQRAANQTEGYGLEVPVTVDPSAEAHVTPTGGLQYY